MQQRTPSTTNDSSAIPAIVDQFIKEICAQETDLALASLQEIVSQQISLEYSIKGQTALNLSARLGLYDVTAKLLEHKANIEGIIPGPSPLSIAVMNNHLEIVRLLISKGADTKRKYGEKQITILHHAAHQGHTTILSELLKVIPNELIDATTEGLTALQIAARKKRLDVIKILIQSTKQIPADLTTNESTAYSLEATTLIDLAMLGISREKIKMIDEELSGSIITKENSPENLSCKTAYLILQTIHESRATFQQNHFQVKNAFNLCELCLNWKNKADKKQLQNTNDLTTLINELKKIIKESTQKTEEILPPKMKALLGTLSISAQILTLDIITTIAKSAQKTIPNSGIQEVTDLLEATSSCAEILLSIEQHLKRANITPNQELIENAKRAIANTQSIANEKLLLSTPKQKKQKPKKSKPSKNKNTTTNTVDPFIEPAIAGTSNNSSRAATPTPAGLESPLDENTKLTHELHEALKKAKEADTKLELAHVTFKKQELESTDLIKTLFEEVNRLKKERDDRDKTITTLKQQNQSDKSLITTLQDKLTKAETKNKAMSEALLAADETKETLQQEVATLEDELTQTLASRKAIARILQGEITTLKDESKKLQDKNAKLKNSLSEIRKTTTDQQHVTVTLQTQASSASTHTLFTSKTTQNTTDKILELEKKLTTCGFQLPSLTLQKYSDDLDQMCNEVQSDQRLLTSAFHLQARIQCKLFTLETRPEIKQSYILKALLFHHCALPYLARNNDLEMVLQILSELKLMHEYAIKYSCYAMPINKKLAELNSRFYLATQHHNTSELLSLNNQLITLTEKEFPALDINKIQLERLSINVEYQLLRLFRTTENISELNILAGLHSCIISISTARQRCRPEEALQLDAELVKIYRELSHNKDMFLIALKNNTTHHAHGSAPKPQ